MLYCNLMETEEYKKLFKLAKEENPYELDYILQIACIKHLQGLNKKSNDIIENEVQEELSTE